MKKDILFCTSLITIFSVLSSTLIGYIFYQNEIFTFSFPAFQFISSAIIGGVFFCLLEYRTTRIQVLGFIVFFVLSFLLLIGKSLSLTYVVRNLFFLGSLCLSIILYHRIISKNKEIKLFLRSFILSLLYALINMLFGIALFIINTVGHLPPLRFIYSVVVYGALIGLGIGFGIDFFFQFRSRLFHLLKINVA